MWLGVEEEAPKKHNNDLVWKHWKRGVNNTSPKGGDHRTPELLIARTVHLQRDFEETNFNVSAQSFHAPQRERLL